MVKTMKMRAFVLIALIAMMGISPAVAEEIKPKICLENWQCGTYVCDGKEFTRKCIDVAACGTVKYKPQEQTGDMCSFKKRPDVTARRTANLELLNRLWKVPLPSSPLIFSNKTACKENWIYGMWYCDGSQMVKQLVDTNTCGTIKNKPKIMPLGTCSKHF